MSQPFTESVVEDAALAWLGELGYTVKHGPEIAAGEPAAERSDPGYRDVFLEGRLRHALARLNRVLPPEALEDAFRKLTRLSAPSLLERNRAAHRMLVDGVTVEYRRKDGSIAGDQARLIDFDDPAKNDWLAVNQFTVAEGQHTRRPDVVLFVNGLPLAVIELKNAADENATVWAAWQQLQTYQAQVPALFATNAALVVSDGVEARIGALGAGREWFKPWRTITGRENAPPQQPELQVVLEGVFERRRFLDLLRHFIVFEDSAAAGGGGGKLVKKMAGYHQFHAVNAAVEETLRAAQSQGAARLAFSRQYTAAVARLHGGRARGSTGARALQFAVGAHRQPHARTRAKGILWRSRPPRRRPCRGGRAHGGADAMARKRVAVLISGRGSNMASLIEAAKVPSYPAEIALVLSNRPGAAGLARAQAEGIATAVVDHAAFGEDREAFERALQGVLDAHHIDLVCLAGFMRLLTPWFVDRWRGRLLNIHPALLPAFKGLDTHARALAAGATVHGATVHFVVPEMDSGPIILQEGLTVEETDTAESLAARVLELEHRIYPKALALVASGLRMP